MSKSPEEEAKLRLFHRNYVQFKRELSEHLGKELTAQDLYDITGLGVDAIRQYDAGKRRAESDSLALLSKAFGRPMEDFMDPAPPPPNPRRMKNYFVRTKVVGDAPPGLEEEIAKVLERWTPERMAQHQAIKKELKRGKKT
jgi:hypothetical protein